jgi:26S proteasome regulatory subunit N5
MSDGALFKPERSFEKEADKVIPEAEALAKKDIQKGIDKIIILEKQSRQVFKPHKLHCF